MPPGFEPGDRGVADLCLTTWLWHHIQNRSIISRSSRFVNAFLKILFCFGDIHRICATGPQGETMASGLRGSDPSPRVAHAASAKRISRRLNARVRLRRKEMQIPQFRGLDTFAAECGNLRGSAPKLTREYKKRTAFAVLFLYSGADYGARTRHLRLGKATLYQMS